MSNMQSIFNEQQAADILSRIDKLNAQSVPLWGKMDVAQMLSHCQKPIEVAIGTLPLNKNFTTALLSLLFGKLIKKQLISGSNLKKNSRTVSQFVVADCCQFEAEKQKLITVLNTLIAKGKNNTLAKKHPFFGNMTKEEWDVLHWKHLDHHLRQFGV